MLFEPISIAGIDLKNRIVRSATFEKRADDDGFVTESLIDLYVELSKGGAGLIITGNALVHVTGRSAPQMLCIHNDFYTAKLKRLTEAVHKKWRKGDDSAGPRWEAMFPCAHRHGAAYCAF
ncbi:hypothetical protein M1N77_00350 [Thermodesulfovibrionales bacterium]|nr:hypothetical protein [Thermodesulfovibrionales bacterium]